MEKLELNIEGMHTVMVVARDYKGFIHHCRSKCYRYKLETERQFEADFSMLKWNKFKETIEDGWFFCVKGE